MTKTWRPIVAGVLNIIVFLFYYWLIFFRADWQAMQSNPTTWFYNQIAIAIFAILGLISLVAGIFSIIRRRWMIALAGSICLVFPILFLGIPATILVISSKKEFIS